MTGSGRARIVIMLAVVLNLVATRLPGNGQPVVQTSSSSPTGSGSAPAQSPSSGR